MVRVTADQVYALLSPHKLTTQQRAAIEGSSLTNPTLVVAGAGSGKTELMTIRILYLVANSIAMPEQILGLTFTKKAASELNARVLRALYVLRESELWPSDLEVDFEPPTITTYNAFGNEVFRSKALDVGYEVDSQVMTETLSVSLVKELLRQLNLDELPMLEDWDKSADYLVSKVITMANELTDNSLRPDQVRAYLDEAYQYVAGLPKAADGSMERFAYTQGILSDLDGNRLVLEVADRYLRAKQQRSLVDFSDQVALALDAVSGGFELPYRFVMLDEYQDTSSIQTKFLSTLFRGFPVMAVGDPNQAIYGWRGASDANLSSFFDDFGEGQRLELTTCWRSGQSIVAAANFLAEPLREASNILPVRLEAIKESEPLQAQVFQTLNEEAEAAAEFFEKQLTGDTSAALLMRTKSAMSVFVDSLQRRGIAVEVSGLSGLLELPEVIDLVCILRVISSTEASTDLIRLLTGPKWAIAHSDIAKLASFAKKLSRIRPEAKGSPVSLIEALDEIRRVSDRDFTEMGEVAFQRLKQAAELLHLMRTKLSLSIAELAWVAVREFDLDIELFAHSKAPNPLAHLEAFISRLAEYEATALRPSLSGLMSWLNYAMQNESFELPRSASKHGVVQVMSIHAAKGLEWDLVLVAQMNQGSFPIEGKDSKGWLSLGKAPFELRADAHSLPSFRWRNCQSQKELKQNLEEFQDQMRDKSLIEERRLAYVAVTRAAKQLRMTASFYKQGAKKPKPISQFLIELVEGGFVSIAELNPAPENPISLERSSVSWPRQQVSERLHKAGELVSSAQRVTNYSPELTLLMEERERSGGKPKVVMPTRLSASAVVSLLTDPEDFFEALRRPMPATFSEAAATGTELHSKIEQFLLASDSAAYELEQSELGVSFLGSRFASLKPLYLEQELQFSMAGLVIVCKLDAVFEVGSGYQIVDWKSGSTPSPADLEARAIQLALYRIGLARWLKVGLEKVQASFYFAKDGVEVSPQRLMTESELVQKLTEFRKAHLG